MNTNPNRPRIFKDVKVDNKIKLSALWVALMFCYTYADILGFYAPGNLEELLSGEIAGIQMTPKMLFGSAVLMAVPTIMILLSLVMMAKANRLVNIHCRYRLPGGIGQHFFHWEKSGLLPVIGGGEGHPFGVDRLVCMEMAEN